MTTIVKKFRKQRERADNQRRAAENRVRFGRGKAARTNGQRDRERAEKTLDDKHLE